VLISGKGNGADDWHLVLDPADPAHDTSGDDVGAGLGDLHRSDRAVFPAIAGFTRVCAYDRPGTGGDHGDRSTPATQPHAVDRDVNDLHQLLGGLGESGPFVLVAHSYGGLIATLFARAYPTSVAGLVMVDAASELIADVLDPAVMASWDEMNQATSPQVPEGVLLADAFAQIDAAPAPPTVPAIVLTADKPYRTDLVPPAVVAELPSFADWLDAQALLAAALGAEHITSTASGHNIYLYSPTLVIDAVRDVVDESRSRPAPSTTG
jgi:pimeloyl-ACP methyl ester carboxylesterase